MAKRRGKNKNRAKKQRRSGPSMAETADKYDLYQKSVQDPERDVALMAKMLSESNPNLKTVMPHHHRLKPPAGRSPADLGKAMAEMGGKAKLIDPKPSVVYTLSK